MKFYGVEAPAWADDQTLAHILRDEAPEQDSDRDAALYLHLADRLEILASFLSDTPTPTEEDPRIDPLIVAVIEARHALTHDLDDEDKAELDAMYAAALAPWEAPAPRVVISAVVAPSVCPKETTE